MNLKVVLTTSVALVHGMSLKKLLVISFTDLYQLPQGKCFDTFASKAKSYNENLLSVSGYKVQRYEQSLDEFEFEQGEGILSEDNEERTEMAVERLQVGSKTQILNQLFSCLVQKQIFLHSTTSRCQCRDLLRVCSY